MDPLIVPPRDEEEDFGKQLLDLLGSPVARHYNGISSLFSPDLNSGNGYELLSNGSLGSPDFTRQLNSAGLHGLANGNRQILPTLQLSQSPRGWPGGWQAESWLGPQSPTCPIMSPLDFSRNGSNFNSSLFANGNGNGWHQNSSGFGIEQLLAGGSEPQLQLQLQPSMTLPDTAAAAPAPQTYSPITPQQQQQQLLPEAPTVLKQEADQLPGPTYPVQPQQQQWQQAVLSQQQQQQQQIQVHLPPGLWLVAPTAHEQVAPVVQQVASPTAGAAAAAAAANNAVLAAPAAQQQQQQQQQQGRKRQLRLPVQSGRKGARTSRSSSPSTASAAAAAAAAAEQPWLQTIPEERGTASLATPSSPTTPAAAAAAAAAAGQPGFVAGSAATSAVGSAGGQFGVGSLVWGKVNRFPWWPAVVVSQRAAAAEPAPSPDTAQHARSANGGGSSSKALVFVRFLGTHDTALLESGKVSPWPVQLSERSSKTKAAAFVNALKEGRVYAATGLLPDAFSEELPRAVRMGQQQQQELFQDADVHAGPDQQQQGSHISKAPHSAATSAVSSISRSTAADSKHSGSSVCVEPPHSSNSVLARDVAPPAPQVAAVLSESTPLGDADQSGGPGGGVASAGAEQGVGRGARSKARPPPGLRAASGRPERAARGAQGAAALVRQTRRGRQLRG